MPIKKILIKNDAGCTIATLTLQTEKANGLRFPPDFLPKRYVKGGMVYPYLAESFPAFSNGEPLSVIGKYAGETAFATTLGGEQAAFTKWKLLQEEKRAPASDLTPLSPPTPPLREEQTPKEGGEPQSLPTPLLEQAQITSPQEGTTAFEQTPDLPAEEAPTVSEDLLTRAGRLIDAAPPFSLFEEMMPGSKWGITGEEGNLLGIVEEDPPRVLVGIPGTRDCPPATERPTSFFPTDDTGETGYFLSELIEEDLS
ncbi:MAG TPA: hypothetical protein DHV31_00270 [Clostridiales bacterium]|nr:hypothetical protein [Clostridiales bacterium]